MVDIRSSSGKAEIDRSSRSNEADSRGSSKIMLAWCTDCRRRLRREIPKDTLLVHVWGIVLGLPAQMGACLGAGCFSQAPKLAPTPVPGPPPIPPTTLVETERGVYSSSILFRVSACTGIQAIGSWAKQV